MTTISSLHTSFSLVLLAALSIVSIVHAASNASSATHKTICIMNIHIHNGFIPKFDAVNSGVMGFFLGTGEPDLKVKVKYIDTSNHKMDFVIGQTKKLKNTINAVAWEQDLPWMFHMGKSKSPLMVDTGILEINLIDVDMFSQQVLFSFNFRLNGLAKTNLDNAYKFKLKGTDGSKGYFIIHIDAAKKACIKIQPGGREDTLPEKPITDYCKDKSVECLSMKSIHKSAKGELEKLFG